MEIILKYVIYPLTFFYFKKYKECSDKLASPLYINYSC